MEVYIIFILEKKTTYKQMLITEYDRQLIFTTDYREAAFGSFESAQCNNYHETWLVHRQRR